MTEREAFEAFVLQSTGRDMNYHATHQTTGIDFAWSAWLAGAASEREQCADLCDKRAADYWHDYKDRGSQFRGDLRTEAMSDEAERCAMAIRALATK